MTVVLYPNLFKIYQMTSMQCMMDVIVRSFWYKA